MAYEDPKLEPRERARLLNDLINGRRAVKEAKNAGDQDAEAAAHRLVDEAKCGLGERGRVWWKDEAPDFNRRAVKNSPHAEWYALF